MALINLNKRYIHYEDNEDGTVTMTVDMKESFNGDLKAVQMVFDQSMDDMITMMITLTTPSAYDFVKNHGTIVPDEPPTG